MSQNRYGTSFLPSLSSRSTLDAVSDVGDRQGSGVSPDVGGQQRRTSYFCQPPPQAHLAGSASQRPSVFPCSRTRSRILSAPSFGQTRVSTTELEKGRKGRGGASFGSVTSSRCSSLDDAETRATPELWNSLFAALGANVPSPGGTTNGQPNLGMLRSGSRISLASAFSLPYDPDDPRITGKTREKAEVDLPSQEDGEAFLIRLSKALMKFGAPSHRIESQLLSAASSMHLKMQVIHIPGITVLSFANHHDKASGCDTRFIKASTKIDLGRLRAVHKLYRRVVHYEESAKGASDQLKVLLKKDPIYGIPEQILIAIICGLILSPMAYRGSVLDLMVAGICCGVISWMHVWAAKQNQMFGNLVEIISVMFVAFVGRGLSSMPEGIFCYSAIVTTGVVKLLPKYLIICSSLELASKQIATGSVKMVYAIIWSLFLGFSITLGSDFYYIIDSGARNRRLQATQYLVDALNLQGSFSMDMSAVRGDFTFTNVTAPTASRLYSANGCFRDPRWPWYLQEPPWWTLLFLVPLYAIFSALAAYQPFRSRELPVMVLVSCCSYAANRGVHILVPSRADISGAIGAFVIGTMSHLYSRIFRGTAFGVMFNGIGFLVPSALAATGGLAQNYRGKTETHYTSSLELAMRMIQVALGTTVGLFTSSLVVYSFGKRKRGALWAF